MLSLKMKSKIKQEEEIKKRWMYFSITHSTSLKIKIHQFPATILSLPPQGLSGGTTVSGTMVVAHKVGIPIFVTGGIGGVHRGAESTMDISADLTELGRTPVTVVSAGVKSILDVGRTLEYLETQGEKSKVEIHRWF